MNPEKILAQAPHNPKDVRFADFVKLVEAFGFGPRRQSGSHRMFSHPGLPTLVNTSHGPMATQSTTKSVISSTMWIVSG